MTTHVAPSHIFFLPYTFCLKTPKLLQNKKWTRNLFVETTPRNVARTAGCAIGQSCKLSHVRRDLIPGHKMGTS